MHAWKNFIFISKWMSLSHFRASGFSSVAQSCLTLCNPINCSTPGLPVHHQLPEFIQTHVHRVGDAIQPSHPLSSPSSPAPNPSQRQGLFQWVNSSQEAGQVVWWVWLHWKYNSLFFLGLLRVPWTARRSNQSILKEISPGCSLERLMLKLKL